MQTEIIELTKLAPPRRPSFGEFLVEQRVLDSLPALSRAPDAGSRARHATRSLCCRARLRAARRGRGHARALREERRGADQDVDIEAWQRPRSTASPRSSSAHDNGCDLCEEALSESNDEADENAREVVWQDVRRGEALAAAMQGRSSADGSSGRARAPVAPRPLASAGLGSRARALDPRPIAQSADVASGDEPGRHVAGLLVSDSTIGSRRCTRDVRVSPASPFGLASLTA